MAFVRGTQPRDLQYPSFQFVSLIMRMIVVTSIACEVQKGRSSILQATALVIVTPIRHWQWSSTIQQMSTIGRYRKENLFLTMSSSSSSDESIGDNTGRSHRRDDDKNLINNPQPPSTTPTSASAVTSLVGPNLTRLDSLAVDESSDAWQMNLMYQPYISSLLTNQEWKDFILQLYQTDPDCDPLWEQIKLEATAALGPEPEAGPQLYQGILSQPSLMEAIVTIIAHEIETELITATEVKNLFLETLTEEDEEWIRSDVRAAANRSSSVGNALAAVLFHMGLHALVCYRVGHRLWLADRKGLAYYLQSTISRRYSADIHPAARLGAAQYLCSTAGVVIGETATTGDDVTILHGVTLGGTGKERGDRHPKVGNGVVLQDGATVLGNIPVGDGAVVTAKSIVTKPVPPLAIVSGVPAKVRGYRRLEMEAFEGDLERHLAFKYLDTWRAIPIDESTIAGKNR